MFGSLGRIPLRTAPRSYRLLGAPYAGDDAARGMCEGDHGRNIPWSVALTIMPSSLR